ncbi:2-oxoglutarate-Fe(II)-dependent oxygenase superfamily protein [Nocardia caishijiensis]|uniref:2-oxoglutarate-Fe(II)-dependent oxygenase superfamily protein n=2 Tax=Nocardia caishijiensis TaxID=184756 RepID=A0ABQ6YHY4_9NOCA|nr:2-oxoglutarate-Fe(II)-dependent oxygenase superfamily protein [Nocardia caishijiensis]
MESSDPRETDGLTVVDNVVGTALGVRIREQLLVADRHQHSEILIGSHRHLAPRLTSSFSDVPLALDGMAPSRPWTPELADLRDLVGVRFGLTFNYALANLYRDRADFTGWHCDKAWLHEPDSTIAIVSFGATRTLAVRAVGTEPAVRYRLSDSSVVLMSLPLQNTHEHCLLAEAEDVDMRLSITLRHIRILPEYLAEDRPSRRNHGAVTTERE